PMTPSCLTALITLQYPLVPTSDPMMLILLVLAAPFILGLIFKGLVILGCGITVIFKFLPYLLTGRTKAYFAEIEEKERLEAEERKRKDREAWEELYRTDRVTRVCFPDKVLDEKYGFTEEIRGDRKAKDWYE
ncbi:MAG: hypothetical protein K2G30_02520, partial [Muribaculaceae bacterium]|nr:hypothetical protein [Muribaculaceae bacterium]